MARLLVATDLDSMAQRGLADRLAKVIESAGHEAFIVESAPRDACRDADGAVCLIDGNQPGAMPIAVGAVASALGMPTLALHTHALDDALVSLFTQAVAVRREADLADALPRFYAAIRPFAGKLVRDQVPRLVREAGHQVQFRQAAPEERPLYLKRKVADEAAELLAADPGQEREEVADLLEALEALLAVRGYTREDLKLVKDAKRKRRGGFERFLVVESATAVTGAPPQEDDWHAPVEPAEQYVAVAPTPPALPPQPAPPTPYAPRSFAAQMAEVPSPAGAPPLHEDAGDLPTIDLDALQEPEPAPPLEDQPVPESFELPQAFQDDARHAEESPQEPDVAVPDWMSGAQAFAAEPEPAPPAPPMPPPGPTLERGSHFDLYQRAPSPPAPPPAPAPFQPVAIPSFRIQQPIAPARPPVKLWNVGARGEKQDIPEAVDDPDRIDPNLRDV